jgi:hypothetical protein
MRLRSLNTEAANAHMAYGRYFFPMPEHGPVCPRLHRARMY